MDPWPHCIQARCEAHVVGHVARCPSHAQCCSHLVCPVAATAGPNASSEMPKYSPEKHKQVKACIAELRVFCVVAAWLLRGRCVVRAGLVWPRGLPCVVEPASAAPSAAQPGEDHTPRGARVVNERITTQKNK